MPNQTQKLGLNTWLENEYVNFEEVNANFEKLDSFTICTESGTKTSPYTGGSDSVATWRYKKYSDGTVEMSAKLNFVNIKCNAENNGLWYSGSSTVNFPFSLSEVYDVQMHLASNTFGWVSDITGQSVLGSVMFRLVALNQETENMYKQVFINVKGVINNG